ncbi:alcohol dehydrogenase catalytic domain-containing protein [Candidatus Nitrosotenuis cloacae]|uniref:alcohol dehydrogenase catalytic domain-containing protein n=1 Tax=Candidatus Nitrosotenuis cloacae TaxID=1603555 RepID=UPI00227DDA81|nr:alcohol dehydrogenase catalytic domain-containing protein [Candidatus Nitrosotenuis cloacae]
MVEKMRAMVLERLAPIETGPLKLKEIERHQIKTPNEILVKIHACGVCRSQLHGIEGDWVKYGIPPALPTIPGHEIVGEIVEIGSKVTKFRPGQRVGISPLHGSCMACDYCRIGKEHLCDAADITGESMLGGYAEYITVSEDFATAIPDSMKSEYAAPLFCAGITAYKAVAAAEPAHGKKVGIFGVGGVGHLAVEFAKINGCRVIGVSRGKNHLDVAKKVGADNVIQYGSDQSEFLSTLKKEEGLLDAAIVFAPSENAVGAAIKSVRKGGTIVLGVLANIPDFDVFSEKTIRGTLIGSRQDMHDVVRLAKEYSIGIVYESHHLEKANDVLVSLKQSKIEARAVLTP